MGIASTVGTSTQPYTTQSGVVSTDPLTSTEKSDVVKYMMSKMGLTKEQAQSLLENITTAQARTFLGLISGKDTITREEAIEMWGLTKAEADILFPNGAKELRSGSTFTNPFGNAFINYLILSYSLGLDIRRMMADVLQTEIDLGIEKANEIFKGAIGQFACAMVAAIVTGICGGLSAVAATKRNSNHQKAIDKNLTQAERDAAARKAATDNQWIGPIAASLLGQPLAAAGEFTNQWFQREGALIEVDMQEADKLYQQLLSFYQSNSDTSTSMAHNLGS